MFEMLTKAAAGDDLSPAMRQKVIRAAIDVLNAELRALPVILPEMSNVQRAGMKLELGRAVQALVDAEQQIEAVKRVADARAALNEHGCTEAEESAAGA